MLLFVRVITLIEVQMYMCVCVCLMLQPRSGVDRGPDLIRAAGLLHRLQELGDVKLHKLSHTENELQLFRTHSRQ